MKIQCIITELQNYEIEINQPIITKLKTPGTTTTQGINKIELQLQIRTVFCGNWKSCTQKGVFHYDAECGNVNDNIYEQKGVFHYDAECDNANDNIYEL